MPGVHVRSTQMDAGPGHSIVQKQNGFDVHELKSKQTQWRSEGPDESSPDATLPVEELHVFTG